MYLAWQEALATASQAALALEELGNVLRAKAGIKDRSPMMKRFIEDCRNRPDVIEGMERVEAAGMDPRDIRVQHPGGEHQREWSEIDYHGRDLQSWKHLDRWRRFDECRQLLTQSA